jgi:ABC-type transport system involved in multi-copper enzyme maturation permease subunit
VNSEAITVPLPDAGRDRPLPVLSASFWIAMFSYREMVRRRRLFSLGLIMLLPVAIALAWRVWDKDGLITAPLLLANLGGVFYVHFLVAIVSLAVGLSAIGEQVAEGTILYYWTRPLGRGAIYVGRLLAAQTVAATLLACSLALCFLVMVLGNFGVVDLAFIKLYVGNSLIIIFGAFVYTAIFALLGTWLKKPMLPAVVFAFGWEALGGSVPLRLQELTVVFHLRNLIRNTEAGTQNVPNLLAEIKRTLLNEQPVPEWRSALALVGTLVVVVLLGIWLLRRKEIFR